MKIIVCKKLGEILSTPVEKTENFVAFSDNTIADHVKNCPECKKGLKKYYDSQSGNLPFFAKTFADKIISKFIGE